MRTLLVANPTAQSGKNADRIARARVLLDQAGLAHSFAATAPAGGTVGVVSKALQVDPEVATAIYMGGDGTFAEVAKGILGSGRAADVRLGMLPTGTANDQGKSFGLGAAESDLARNIEVIAAGRECRLDAGRLTALDAQGATVREELFFDSAGWGISAKVLGVRNDDREVVSKIPLLRELYRDHLVYASAALRTFAASYLEDQKFEARGTADGQPVGWSGLSELVVKGTRIYGGMWVFDTRSQPDDGRFELIPFTGKRDWVSKALVHLDQSGVAHQGLAQMGITESQSVQFQHLDLTLTPRDPAVPLCAQIDGEEFPGSSQIRVEVLPRALRLVVPAEYAR